MIQQFPFGTLSDGTAVTRYRIGDDTCYADILDYGATIQSVVVPDQNGDPVDVVLGFADPRQYETVGGCLGATVGRHANRIGLGRFTLNGTDYQLETNNGPNHLHGGCSGWHRRMFAGETDGEILKLRLHSPHGDQGYPGNLDLTVTYSFAEGVLTAHFAAVCDRDTVLNLTNHSYFDLSGGRDPMGQRLFLASERFCENDENALPTGELIYVFNTPFDFRQEKALGRDLDAGHPQLALFGGYDHNFVLDNDGRLAPCASLRSSETGIVMAVYTDLPGVQLYSANALAEVPGKDGRVYGPHQAVCLEPQFFPDALHHPEWKQPILRAGEIFDHSIVYQFG